MACQTQFQSPLLWSSHALNKQSTYQLALSWWTNQGRTCYKDHASPIIRTTRNHSRYTIAAHKLQHGMPRYLFTYFLKCRSKSPPEHLWWSLLLLQVYSPRAFVKPQSTFLPDPQYQNHLNNMYIIEATWNV